MFGVTKFNKFLYGRKVTLLTDHEALTVAFVVGLDQGYFYDCVFCLWLVRTNCSQQSFCVVRRLFCGSYISG